MIPKAQLVVYYLSHDGEIISDRVEIEFGNELINHVRVTFLNFLQFYFIFLPLD